MNKYFTWIVAALLALIAVLFAIAVSPIQYVCVGYTCPHGVIKN